MSSISTELTIPDFNKLFTEKEIEICTFYNLKVFLLIIFIIIVICSLCSISGIFTTPTQFNSEMYLCGCNSDCSCQGNCNANCGCSCQYIEQFSNETLGPIYNKYTNSSYPNYTSYQSVALTPLNSESLLFGQANQHIKASDDGSQPVEYILDVFANLYLLDANPFGQSDLKITSIPQNYLVYLSNTSERKLLGILQANADEVYKLHFKSKSPLDYIKYNTINIVYSNGTTETPLLTGNLSA